MMKVDINDLKINGIYFAAFSSYYRKIKITDFTHNPGDTWYMAEKWSEGSQKWSEPERTIFFLDTFFDTEREAIEFCIENAKKELKALKKKKRKCPPC